MQNTSCPVVPFLVTLESIYTFFTAFHNWKNGEPRHSWSSHHCGSARWYNDVESSSYRWFQWDDISCADWEYILCEVDAPMPEFHQADLSVCKFVVIFILFWTEQYFPQRMVHLVYENAHNNKYDTMMFILPLSRYSFTN